MSEINYQPITWESFQRQGNKIITKKGVTEVTVRRTSRPVESLSQIDIEGATGMAHIVNLRAYTKEAAKELVKVFTEGNGEANPIDLPNGITVNFEELDNGTYNCQGKIFNRLPLKGEVITVNFADYITTQGVKTLVVSDLSLSNPEGSVEDFMDLDLPTSEEEEEEAAEAYVTSSQEDGEGPF